MKVDIDYNGWQFYDDLVKGYGEYYLYHYGDHTVYVEDIVGLSYEGVLSQEKIERLYESIKKDGYYFERYADLHLVLLPNKKYSVCTGGNHRPYIAKKFGMKKIKCNAEILIPKNYLSEEEIAICEEIDPVNSDHDYFRMLCEAYDLMPSKMRINIQ